MGKEEHCRYNRKRKARASSVDSVRDGQDERSRRHLDEGRSRHSRDDDYRGNTLRDYRSGSRERRSYERQRERRSSSLERRRGDDRRSGSKEIDREDSERRRYGDLRAHLSRMRESPSKSRRAESDHNDEATTPTSSTNRTSVTRSDAE